ncbi:MAG: hypothetical protein U0X71_04850 [Sphingobacteriaceae bacterium]|jgi:hypothetical protein
MNWANLFVSKKTKLNSHQLALMLEYYENNPELTVYDLSRLFNVGVTTADRYISTYLFGIVRGERINITLPSKMNY